MLNFIIQISEEKFSKPMMTKMINIIQINKKLLVFLLNNKKLIDVVRKLIKLIKFNK